MALHDKNLTSHLKLNALVLNQNVENKISRYIHGRMAFKNVLIFYQFSRVFGLSSLYRQSLNCVERCFTMLAETRNLLELDYTAIVKLLGSNQLHITSELEVFNLADAWLSHNIEEHTKLAKYVLLKVRLPLLSDDSLKYILNKTSSFTCIDECVLIIKEALISKEKFQNKSTYRYCKHNTFNVLVFGSSKYLNTLIQSVHQVDGSNLNTVKVLPSLVKERFCSEAVCLKGDVYVFGGFTYKGLLTKHIMSVEKYSPSTNTWKKVAKISGSRRCFCVCAYMDKVFVLGGYKNKTTSSCLQFNTTNYKWKKIARMNEGRSYSACAVFEGNVIVCGGLDNQYNKKRNVDSYDVMADKWSPMADMINRKSGHKLVVVKSKLYVIGSGGDGCEVYDSINKMFVALKSPLERDFYFDSVISIGTKIVMFPDGTTSVKFYDVDSNEWTEEPCDVKNNIQNLSCVKVPWF